MKNITVVVLSVLLAVAAGTGIFLYQQNKDTNRSLEESKRSLLELREKVIPSRDAQVAQLQKDLKDREQEVQELENALSLETEKLAEQKKMQESVSTELSSRDVQIAQLREDLSDREQKVQELEHAVSMQEEKLRAAEEALATEQKQRRELDAGMAKLQEDLNNSQARIQSLTSEFAQKQSEIEDVNNRIANLKGQHALTESRMNQLKSTYDALISDLHQQIEKREVTIKGYEKMISVTFVDSVLFDLGKATITGEGREILKGVGDILKEVQSKQIRIVGHTDNIPIAPQFLYKFPSNWELSAARAAAVVRYFQDEINIDPKNLEVVGRSFYEPISGNDTAAGRAENRRVNIIIAPKAE